VPCRRLIVATAITNPISAIAVAMIRVIQAYDSRDEQGVHVGASLLLVVIRKCKD
jgi:hypothetical protein